TVGNRSYIRIDSDSSTYLREILLTNGLQDGQILMLQCVASCDFVPPPPVTKKSGPSPLQQGPKDDPDGIRLNSSSNVQLGDYRLDERNSIDMWNSDTITLIWDANMGEWIEIARAEKDLCV